MRGIYLIAISVFISVTATLLLSGQSPKIVVIDRDEIFKSMIVQIQQATANDDEEAMMAKLQKYKNTKELLDREISKIAKKRNFIILPKNNVIGGEDLTNQAKELLSDLIKETKVIDIYLILIIHQSS
jgi:hypothetical protein